MNRKELWNAFSKTGRIEDYLRYCGVDIYETPMAKKETPEHASDNRRPDHSGKQDYH